MPEMSQPVVDPPVAGGEPTAAADVPPVAETDEQALARFRAAALMSQQNNSAAGATAAQGDNIVNKLSHHLNEMFFEERTRTANLIEAQQTVYNRTIETSKLLAALKDRQLLRAQGIGSSQPRTKNVAAQLDAAELTQFHLRLALADLNKRLVDVPLHDYATGRFWGVLGLAIWRERRLVWTLGGAGNHFYYGVEGLKWTEICTRNRTFACVLHQIALFRFWIDIYH